MFSFRLSVVFPLPQGWGELLENVLSSESDNPIGFEMVQGDFLADVWPGAPC